MIVDVVEIAETYFNNEKLRIIVIVCSVEKFTDFFILIIAQPRELIRKMIFYD